jgi:hypothetical protein
MQMIAQLPAMMFHSDDGEQGVHSKKGSIVVMLCAPFVDASSTAMELNYQPKQKKDTNCTHFLRFEIL